MKINKERIKHLVKKKYLKQKEIAVKIGATPQDWNNWMFRGIFPHFDKLEKVAEILEVNVNTLIAEQHVSEPLPSYGKNNFIRKDDLIPFYEIEANTKSFFFWNDHTSTLPKDYVYIPGLNADFIFHFYGNGMQPKIENGDWIALRKLKDLSLFNYGSLHLVVTKEQIVTRYLKKSTKANRILLCAEDDFYDTIDLPIDAIKSLYAIVSVIKRETF